MRWEEWEEPCSWEAALPQLFTGLTSSSGGIKENWGAGHMWLVHLITMFSRVTVQFVKNVPICYDKVPVDWHSLPRGLTHPAEGTFWNVHAMRFRWKCKHQGRKLALAAVEQPYDCCRPVVAHIRRIRQTGWSFPTRFSSGHKQQAFATEI